MEGALAPKKRRGAGQLRSLRRELFENRREASRRLGRGDGQRALDDDSRVTFEVSEPSRVTADAKASLTARPHHSLDSCPGERRCLSVRQGTRRALVRSVPAYSAASPNTSGRGGVGTARMSLPEPFSPEPAP